MTDDQLLSLAARHRMSLLAVAEVCSSLRATGGTLAQFDHPDLGGRGQWMPGMTQIGAMFDEPLKTRVAALCAEVATLVKDSAGARTGGGDVRLTRPASGRRKRTSGAEERVRGTTGTAIMEPMKPMKPMGPMKPMDGMKPMDRPTPMRQIDPMPAWWPATYGTPNAAGGQNDVRYAWFADRRRLLVDVAGYVAAYDTADHRISGIAQSQGDETDLVFRSQHGPIALESLRAVEIDG